MGNNKPNFERTTKNLDRKMADRKMKKRKPNVYGLRMRLLPFSIFLSAIFLSKLFLLNASNMLAPFLALFQIHNLSIWRPISPARRWTACSKWLLRKKADPGKSGRADQRPLCGAFSARPRDEEFSVAYRRIGLRVCLEGVLLCKSQVRHLRTEGKSRTNT